MDDGAHFRIQKSGDAPTIQSDFYIMYGNVSCNFRAAPGAGIVSSLVLLSDVLDEIDWVCSLHFLKPASKVLTVP